MKGDQSPNRRRWTAVLLPFAGIGLTGFAVATTVLYRSNEDFKRQVNGLTEELDRAKDALVRALGENDALRTENNDQQAVIEAEREGRLKAEAGEKAASSRAKRAEAKVKVVREKLVREKALRVAAEERAVQEARRAREEAARRAELEKETAELEEQIAIESRRNLGNALASLKSLEEEMPVHAQDEDAARRHVYMRHDCSVLHRLSYDFTDAHGDESIANARERRDQLEARYERACNDVR